MAYQFFAKAHQSKQSSSPPLSPPQPYNSNRPPIHPAPLVFPQSTSSTATSKPPTAGDSTFQPDPYPQSIPAGYPTPHPHVTIETVSTAHIPSLTRITGLLLPIRYPNSFYTATITDPVIASVSRVAIYHDHPVAAAPASSSSPSALGRNTGTDKVIGGIRCRLERFPQVTSELLKSQNQKEPTNLYIQTLHLLSPYRGTGVAASLFNSLIFASSDSKSGYRVSDLVKHYNIRTVTAHVHEANEEGLNWYLARGFQLEDGVVENYYRRLKPSGAKIVRFVIQRSDDEEVSANNAKDEGESRDEKSPDDDDDWEKIEAEDGEEHEDHGVRPITDSKSLEREDSGSRKRKADDEPQRQ
ncbi:hypothetical protein ASPWEDRAFT_35741 [Aspergillus wentii DTO 134E9]|uniref:N-acetyltransferase domain-containing protein n=1 Tax=Aspergillus wentii DTO 134E9 TaxID=1073089 RepID=A0A1L9RTF1_ASPWE|nr:uncharacterized protein ASPWEDRAFT_35741 [Aspergillus wentii DTO 134E9]KAI9933818.1 hypothetical protein MW887_004890 [Aspergillus wentii]OJJ38163.1 hypothetical protein ASPWEDRAFT_35741 [Aspergillus wentii DTO 134E9]